MAAGTLRTGGVTSRLMVTERVAVPPSLVAVQVKVVPEVSEETVVAAQPVLDVTVSGSLTLQLTVTSLTYHPFAPVVPVTVRPMTGGVVSTSRWRIAFADRAPSADDAVSAKGKSPLELMPGWMERLPAPGRGRAGSR